MRAADIHEGEVYELGHVSRYAGVTPSGRRVRVITKGVTRYGGGKATHHCVRFLDDEGNDVILRTDPLTREVLYSERVVNSRELMSVAEAEDYLRVKAEAEEQRRLEQEQRETQQTLRATVIATRLNISSELVNVRVVGPFDDVEDEADRWRISSCTIEVEGAEEVYAGASLCEDCGENGGRKLRAVEIQEEVHVFLCEDCIDKSRMDYDEARHDAGVY